MGTAFLLLAFSKAGILVLTRALQHPSEDSVRASKDKNERRSSDRFPIERDVRFRILSKKATDEAGTGKTVNMSSSGVLFTSDKILLPGKRLEISVSWPAQLDNVCPLKLVARGRVVRSESGTTAIEIQQYEFRTQGGSGGLRASLIQ